MSKLGIFRFEIVSLALIPLATGLVLAGFEGLRRIQRHLHPGTPESGAGAGLAASLVSGRAPARTARLLP